MNSPTLLEYPSFMDDFLVEFSPLNFNDEFLNQSVYNTYSSEKMSLSKESVTPQSTLSTDSIINFDVLDEDQINLDILLNQDINFDDTEINEIKSIPDISKSYNSTKRKTKHQPVLPYNIHDIKNHNHGNLKNEDLIRGKPGDRLLLSNEEKQLLIKEGYHLPTHLPLTKTEERVLKFIRRKIRNKISAKNSRAKKETYVDGLEERIVQCSKENAMLKNRLLELEQDKMSLVNQVLNLRQQVAKFFGDPSIRSSTSLMLVLLTFMLILSPLLDPRQLLARTVLTNDDSNNNKKISPGRILMHLQESEESISLGEPYMITLRPSPPWKFPPETPAVTLPPLTTSNISVKNTKSLLLSRDQITVRADSKVL